MLVDISIMCSGCGGPERWRLFMVVTVRTVIQESPGTGSNPHETTFNKRRAAPFCSGDDSDHHQLPEKQGTR